MTILKPDGEMLGEIVAGDVCGAWSEAFRNPEKPYSALTDPVSMPSPLVGVVFWSKGVPVGAAQVLCYDSIVSREVVKKTAPGTKVEIPLTYVIGTNKRLTRLVLVYLEKEAKAYLKSLDPKAGLTPGNLLARAGITEHP